MKNGMAAATGVILAALWLLLARPAEAGGVVGGGLPGSCTPAALHAKLAGGGLVTFNCGAAPVTIVISPTELITLNTTIQGAANITLSGGSAHTLFDIEDGQVSLSDLTLANGRGANGGALEHQGGSLNLTRLTFLNNHATVRGGAIYSSAPLTITQSSFLSNTAEVSGGAIHAPGALTILDSQFQYNHGLFDGALHSQAELTIQRSAFISNTADLYYAGALTNLGTAAISDSRFYSNTSHNIGGAIFNAFNAQMRVQGSTFFDNQAATNYFGGGIYNLGSLVVDQTTFASNTAAGGAGGGLAQGTEGAALVLNSTFTANVALLGGGIVTSGTVAISNTTFAGNAAFGGGAILAQQGTLTVTNSTLAGNDALSAHAIYNNGGVVRLKNTVLDGNPSSTCLGSIVSLGHNLDSGHTCGLSASGDLTDTSPLLGPLADNGGPTQTLALLPGSPAINAGDNSGCPAADQRGFLRLGACDMGAFEVAFRLLLPVLRR